MICKAAQMLGVLLFLIEGFLIEPLLELFVKKLI
jgi:hypothetical protein